MHEFTNLRGGDLPTLRLEVDAQGRRKLVQTPPAKRAKSLEGLKEYVDVRRSLRVDTYALIHRVA